MLKKVTLLLAVGMVLATTGAAQAQLYPPQACNAGLLSASDTTVVPGQTITVSGCGFAPNTRIEITFESVPQLLRSVLSLPTSSPTSESFSTDVVIPSDAPPGGHTLKASGLGADGGRLVLSIPVEVSDPDASLGGAGGSAAVAGGRTASGSGTLARTGSGATLALLQAGLALVLVGAGLVAVVQRRRRSQPARSEPATG